MDPLATSPPPDGESSGAARSRAALVLGGGALTGGAYGVGALRAFDMLSAGRTVNDFDVYIGTSSGSFLAALAANGVRSHDMLRVLLANGPSAFPPLGPGTLLPPDLPALVRSGLSLPKRVLGGAWRVGATRDRGALIDALLGVLPAGVCTTRGIESYVRAVLTTPPRTDDFRALEPDLFIAATDLDSCERVILGEPGWEDVPISRAVSASTALPVLYSPVRVGDRELVDGGVSSTTNLDLAVAHGAMLVVVVNPLAPYRNVSGGNGGAVRRISDLGFSQIAYQSFKLLAHQRLHDMQRLWEERYPGVDIVLIEPAGDDELMFEISPISYSARAEIAWHGFRSVAAALAGDDEEPIDTFARHGVSLEVEGVHEAIARASGGDGAWREVLDEASAAPIS